MLPTSSVSAAAIPLWIAPLALLVGALLALLRSGAGGPARRLVLAAPVLALLALAPNAIGVARGGEVVSSVVTEKALSSLSRLGLVLEQLATAAARGVRVGSLDAPLTFSLDRTGALLSVSLLVSLLVVVGRAPKDHGSGRAPAVFVLGAAALFAVLADGMAGWLVGTTIAVFAAAWAVRSAPRALGGLGLGASGISALATGIAYLFWSLGGQWLDDSRYLSDWGPRFVVDDDASAPGSATKDLARDPHATGSLTLVSHPGARVYLGVADESQLARSEPFAIAPFVRAELPAGVHKIVIVPGDAAVIGGDGLEAALVDMVGVRPGTETRIRVEGSSLAFREMTSENATRPLGTRRLGASRAATFAVGLMLLGVLFLLMSARELAHAVATDGESTAALAACVPLLAVAALVARSAPLLGSDGEVATWIMLLGLIFAGRVLRSALRARRATDGDFVSLAGVGVLVAVASGAGIAAPAVAVGVVLGVVARSAAPVSSESERGLLSAALAAAPAIGLCLVAAATPDGDTSMAALHLGAAGLVAASLGVIAALPRTEPREARSDGARLGLALAACTAAVVAVLGARPWPFAAGVGAGARVLCAVLVAFATAAGWLWARRLGGIASADAVDRGEPDGDPAAADEGPPQTSLARFVEMLDRALALPLEMAARLASSEAKATPPAEKRSES